MRFRNSIVAAALMASLALPAMASLTNTAEPCLDNAITGELLTKQYGKYAEARDAVVAIQGGVAEAHDGQLVELVTEEVQTAVKSWVRAACACYLGRLKNKAKDLAGAREAYEAAAYYAKLAVKFDNDEPEKIAESNEQGIKYLQIATAALHKLK